ncbi:MAG: hypothetical protein HC942_02470 [Microcoleus sp. SU_5_6]|nr:hypothetical protein [Microcoleus sp. SU_5_6]
MDIGARYQVLPELISDLRKTDRERGRSHYQLSTMRAGTGTNSQLSTQNFFQFKTQNSKLPNNSTFQWIVILCC